MSGYARSATSRPPPSPAPHRRQRSCVPTRLSPLFLRRKALRLTRPCAGRRRGRVLASRAHETVHRDVGDSPTALLARSASRRMPAGIGQASSAQAATGPVRRPARPPTGCATPSSTRCSRATSRPEGNLAGVTPRLDHVRDLGATVVWLMPIHPIGHEKRKGTLGSPYSIRDYYAVNPDYGTPDDVKTARARGPRARPPRDPRRGREPHLVGQRPDEDAGALRARRAAGACSRRAPTGPTWRSSTTRARRRAPT